MSIDRERERERTREAKGDSECKIDGKTLLYAYFAHFTTGFTFSLSPCGRAQTSFRAHFKLFVCAPLTISGNTPFIVCVCVKIRIYCCFFENLKTKAEIKMCKQVNANCKGLACIRCAIKKAA